MTSEEHVLHFPKESNEIPLTECSKEKIERGSTSIYIFESHQCIDGVRNPTFDRKSIEDGSEIMSNEKCAKNVKRSTKSDEIEDETVIVVRKRGNKVFIEF